MVIVCGRALAEPGDGAVRVRVRVSCSPSPVTASSASSVVTRLVASQRVTKGVSPCTGVATLPSSKSEK